MFLSLSHPYPHFSSKPPDDSPFPLFLSPSSSKTSLRFQNPKPPKSLLRSSLPKPTTTTTATDTVAKSAIQRIAEKLRSLGYLDENQINPSDRPHTGPGSAGEIFIPTPHEIPKHRVGHTIDSSWSTPENPIPEPGSGTTITRFHEIRREGKGKVVSPSPEAVPTVAELMIPAEELKRLRSVGIRLEKRLKVGKPGITEGIVNGIHERWRRSELVKIKCEDLCRMNMKRTHETLERKTGGLVVWRSGSIIILFRGANYKYPYFYDGDKRNESLGPGTSDGAPTEQEENSFFAIAPNPSAESSYPSARSLLIAGVGSPKKVRFQQPGEVQLEEEADQLLDGLGPRFTDWWGCDPLPVDADLLPAIVPGYRKPFRLLPFGVKPKLTDREMTILRRLGRPLPCHFAVGRNRKLQGLALSMIKLWEKCEVAKIAVKRGVQNTNTEIMVEELKQLTGGTLLSRDKEFIVFYRGKDFLPPAVSIAIEERRNYDNSKQKQKAYENSSIATTPAFESGFAVEELQEVNEKKELLAMGTRVKSANLALKRVDTKLSQTLEKKEKAEKLLVKLEKSVEPPITESDREAISEEERYMLRRVGLRMKPFLLLGRRGVFDGTVENMHLHWKYRELVKIISKDRGAEDVQRAARTLEAESGGILVAVERVNKGHAIIVYRGKNYRRPADLRPRTLLNKREAMKRSLEAQRSESLKLHVLSLSRNIDQLKHQLMKDDSVVDSMQLTERTRSSTGFETGDCNVSAERDHNRSAESAYHQENTEEVHEADAEILHSDECACSSSDTAVTVNTSTNVTESTVPVGYMEDRFVASKHEDELPKTEVVQSFSQPGFSAHIPLKEMGYIFDESASHPVQQGQTSCLAKNNSHIPAKDSIDLSLGASQGEPNSSVHEDEMEVESNVTFSFKASPLSNRERLILRKQALKMKKRPVLAVGRSNVLTGVAKTIKTHFQKYPLAIVNIKGMAKGTSIQEVIFELEQATGAVLVSREPNKVILYRGWGEGEEPGGPKEKDARKTSRGVKEVVSPELMAAIKLECGLQGNQVE